MPPPFLKTVSSSPFSTPFDPSKYLNWPFADYFSLSPPTDILLHQVTDSRDAAPRPQPPSRRPTSRFITMDSVLQYTSEVPSMQKRQGQERPKSASRTASGRPADPRLTGKFAPPGVPVPGRSTKVSEKLVLLPDTANVDGGELEEDEKGDWEEDNEGAPMRDDEEAIRRRGAGQEKVKSYAERLPKSRRTEKLARVTAYCTAQAYKLLGTAEFLREKHGVKTKLYDDCLYVAYHLPLLPGNEGYRIKSSPALKSAGGKAVLDEEIERSERRDYWEGYFGSAEEDEHSVKGESPRESPEESPGEQDSRRKNRGASLEDGPTLHDDGRHRSDNEHDRRDSDQSHRSVSPPRIPSNVFAFAEAFIFIYGVVVFWNFTEKQERDVLADLTFFAPLSGLPLVTLPLREEDFETEEFHFEYSADILRPRIYNDMITLRSGDHMVKLTMSHAIAQSTKLSFFEEAMSAQMEDAKHVPKRLALTGQLGMKREEVVKILGSLFKSRVDVNLCTSPSPPK